MEVVVEKPEIMLVEKIKRVRRKDEKVVKVVEEMKKVRVRALRKYEWEIEEDLVLKEVCVPKYKKLRLEVIWLHHDVPVIGHRGR